MANNVSMLAACLLSVSFDNYVVSLQSMQNALSSDDFFSSFICRVLLCRGRLNGVFMTQLG